MIIHIGLPRAASTAIEQFIAGQRKVAHADLHDLLSGVDPQASYVRAESVIDGVRRIDIDPSSWGYFLYKPGAWGMVRKHVLVDLNGHARMIRDKYPHARILLISRDYDDWIRSVYHYCAHQLPWGQRSFAHYLSTPSGLTHSMINFPHAQEIFYRHFGWDNVLSMRYEQLKTHTEEFMQRLCKFCDVESGTLPKANANRWPLWLKRAVP